MRKLYNFAKNILDKFNYTIEHKNSWYKRQENFLAEIEDDDKDFLTKMNNYTMCKPANHWAIIQSLHHIKDKKIEGDVVECGIYKGGNLILFDYLIDKLNLKNTKIYGYDTFDGMTEPGVNDNDLKNKSAILTKNNYEKIQNTKWCYSSENEVIKNIKKFTKGYEKFNLIKGDVLKTLDYDNNIPEKISLLRLDTDFYESTLKELEILYPRLEKNGILIIDDYGHWQGARKAVDEYFNLKENFKWFHRIDYASRLLIK